MRTAVMSLVCSMLFAGVILRAEELSGQLAPPVVAKADPKSGNENVDATATNNWNYFQKFNEWEALMEGKNGMPKDEAKARQILTQLIKGVYSVKFSAADGFNPQTPGGYLQTFRRSSSLQSGKDRLGGSGFFRTKRENNKLMASFLTEQPTQMKQDIEKNPQLVFISMEEITPDKFISHVKSAQDALGGHLLHSPGRQLAGLQDLRCRPDAGGVRQEARGPCVSFRNPAHSQERSRDRACGCHLVPANPAVFLL